MVERKSLIRKLDTEKVIAATLLVAILGLTGVLLYIGKYNVLSFGDDFSYAKKAVSVWKNNYSIWEMITYSFREELNIWKTWEGLYFSDFIYQFLIGICAEDNLWIVPYVSLLVLVVCGICAGILVLAKIVQLPISRALLLIIPVVLFQILFTPSPAEGFYWLGSALNHTLSYAFAELAVAVWLYLSMQTGGKGGHAGAKIALLLLCFAIGGGSYVASIPLLCAGIVLSIYSWIKKSDERVYLTICLIWFVCCLALNILSPGASNRQNAAGEGYSAIEAIINSFYESFNYIKMWISTELKILLLLMIPICIGSYREIKFSFKMPIIFILLSLGIYSSMFTPCLYALQMIGPYRVQNLYRFALYVLLVSNEWYLGGWIYKKINFSKITQVTSPVTKNWIETVKLIFAAISICFFALYMHKFSGRTMTFNSAYYSLRSGQFERYVAEDNARKELLKDTSSSVVYLEKYENAPYLINFDDIGEDENDSYNRALAHYYDKEYVYTITE